MKRILNRYKGVRNQQAPAAKPVIPGLEQLGLDACRLSIETKRKRVVNLAPMLHHHKERNIPVSCGRKLNSLILCREAAPRFGGAAVGGDWGPGRPRAQVFRVGVEVEREQRTVAQKQQPQACAESPRASQ